MDFDSREENTSDWMRVDAESVLKETDENNLQCQKHSEQG
jgi:hypothetical protein